MTGLFSPSDHNKKPQADDKQSSRPKAVRVAPTGGAAAALAAGVNNPIRENVPVDYDAFLLSELGSLNVNRASDVNWDGIRLESAQERWNELLEEWQSSDAMDESMLTLPLSELATIILERKTSAERAAETVEAVDLPPPEALNAREV
jgi:hypothetical protein